MVRGRVFVRGEWKFAVMDDYGNVVWFARKTESSWRAGPKVKATFVETGED